MIINITKISKLIILLSQLIVACACASEYSLENGKQYDLCQAFKNNLDLFKNEPPMVCKRDISPVYSDLFTKPDWKTVDPTQYLGALKDLVSHWNRKGSKEDVEKAWSQFNDKVMRENVILKSAYFDLDFNGKKENVYLLIDGNCSFNNINDFNWPTDPNVFVVNKNENKLDMQYKRIYSWAFDPIIYDGRSYLTNWRGSDGFQGGYLKIYETTNPRGVGMGIHEVCAFKYVNNKNKE